LQGLAYPLFLFNRVKKGKNIVSGVFPGNQVKKILFNHKKLPFTVSPPPHKFNIIARTKVMRIIDFKKLSWPANTNMDLLTQCLTERELLKLLKFFADKPETDRIIRMPKQQTIVKSILFYYLEQVAVGKMKEKDALIELKLKLGNLCPSKKEIKRLYNQRKKEILEGK